MKWGSACGLGCLAALLAGAAFAGEGGLQKDGTATLTIIIEGEGTTFPPGSAEPGISYIYPLGETAGVSASLGVNGWAFNNWAGDVPAGPAASPHIKVLMDRDRTIRARYLAADWTLTLAVSGNGEIEPPPGEYGFVHNSTVNLAAHLITGGDAFYQFSDGTPGLQSTFLPYMEVTMDRNRSITAEFVPGDWHVVVTGPLEGCAVSLYPEPGIYAYLNNSMAYVKAYAGPGCYWRGWTGDLQTVAFEKWFDVNRDMTVTPDVTTSGYSLDLSASGQGETYPPPGHWNYAEGVELNVWALSTGSDYFSFWEGDVPLGRHRDNPLYTVMNQDYTLKAVFVGGDWYLSIQVIGAGTTDPRPDLYWHYEGDEVHITALPEAGNVFYRWMGALPEGTDPTVPEITLTISQNVELLAMFVPGEVYVPNVTGMPLQEAEMMLRQGGAVLGEVTYDFSNTVPRDTVIRQTPAPGSSVSYGVKVNLVVSLGACYTETPNLLGMPLESAAVALLNANLLVGSITHAFSDTVPEGRVMSQETPAGLVVLCRGFVDFTLSLGLCESLVPDLRGMTETEAASALQTADLVLGTVFGAYDPDMPVNHIAAQSVPPGEEALCGTSIYVFVSLGPCHTEVPDATGLTEEEARMLFEAAQLYIAGITWEYSNDMAVNKTLRHAPAGGTLAACDSGITLVISLGPCFTEVPEMVGLSLTQAELFLATYLLTTGEILWEYNDLIPEDRIIVQSTAPWTNVLCGTALDLVVSLGACSVQTPNVTGLLLNEAQAVLENNSLQAGKVTQVYSMTVPPYRIISQTPLVGTTAACGTAVDMEVSLGPCLAPVPDLTGMTIEEARNAVAAAGFVFGAATPEGSETVPEGLILRQFPVSGGAPSVCGATIRVVVSAGGYVPSCPRQWHSADTNHDYQISVAELLRVIQFYNSHGYHCALTEEETEDGFVPGMIAEHACCPHHSDFAGNVPDWSVDLNELLRLIQFYNMGAYGCEPGSEDGFSTTPGGCDAEGEGDGEGGTGEGTVEGGEEGGIEGEGEAPPFFITAGFVDVENLSCISYFRSSTGGDYSAGSPETCRSMKHYFTLLPDADWRMETVYAPVAGQITALTAETLGSRMEITVDGYPEYRIILAHMAPAPSLAVGNSVLAGQPVGTFYGDSVNIAVHGPDTLYSYFELLTEGVFEPYRARGVSSRAQLIISREERDNDPLECLDIFTPPRILTEGHLPAWYCFEDVPGEGEYVPSPPEGEAPPQFITADFVRAEHIQSISYFRSSAGHSYAEGTPESCRSMKHYFDLYPDINFHVETIYSPISGTVDILRDEGNGTQLEILVDHYPNYRVHIFHVAIIPTITVGYHVRAGQPLGTFTGHGTDIAVRGNNALYSYFEAMTDAVFAGYQARGITSRTQLVISKTDRDNDPLECYEGVVPAQFLTHGHLPIWYNFTATEGEAEGETEEGEGEGYAAGEEREFGGMIFVWCPPGQFAMGAPDGEVDRTANEQPQHTVTLSKGFWLAKYETTQAQWQAVMGVNPAYFKGDSRPVECVSWNRVQEYIAALNGLNPGMDFRLPTEAEWEYACRAGTATRFYWGDDLDGSLVEQHAWTDLDSWGRTHGVGLKTPNPWGLHDMSGNVSEWTQDWFGAYSGGPVNNPAGPVEGTTRAVRGGCWGVHYPSCRSASRVGYAKPDFGFNYLGFRLAR